MQKIQAKNWFTNMDWIFFSRDLISLFTHEKCIGKSFEHSIYLLKTIFKVNEKLLDNFRKENLKLLKIISLSISNELVGFNNNFLHQLNYKAIKIQNKNTLFLLFAIVCSF